MNIVHAKIILKKWYPIDIDTSEETGLSYVLVEFNISSLLQILIFYSITQVTVQKSFF